jgi:hypothetical protein
VNSNTDVIIYKPKHREKTYMNSNHSLTCSNPISLAADFAAVSSDSGSRAEAERDVGPDGTMRIEQASPGYGELD